MSGRIGDAVCLALAACRAALLFASLLLVLVAVVFRYAINHSLVFTDDLLALFFTWLVFLGIPASIWFDRAPRLDVLLSLRVDKILVESIPLGVSFGFFSFVTASGIALLPSQLHMRIETLGLSDGVAGAAVVVSGLLGATVVVLKACASPRAPRWWFGALLGAGFVCALLTLPIPHNVAAVAGIVILLAVGAPIAVALGVAGIAMVAGGTPAAVTVPAAQMLQGTGHITLIAILFFMLMGGLIAHSNLSRNLANFVQALFGRLPGGIGVACIGTACIFANMSGSAVADTAALGTVFIPQLTERGSYSREEAAALQAAAGVIGVIFPPAIAMILFGTVANLNVVEVFKAAIVPGILVALLMAAITVGRAVLRRDQRGEPFQLRTLLASVPAALPVLAIPIVLDAGIFTGVFTPSESGAVASALALVLVVITRGITPRGLWGAIEQAVDGTTLVMFILVAVSILDYGFVTSSIATNLQHFLETFGTSPLGVLILVNAIFLIVHVFVETAPSILVMVPLVLPTCLAVGIDPLQLAGVVAVNSTIGLVLPPVGVSLFVASQIARVNPANVVRPVLPYVAGSLVALVLVTSIPSLTLTLPRLWP